MARIGGTDPDPMYPLDSFEKPGDIQKTGKRQEKVETRPTPATEFVGEAPVEQFTPPG